MRAPNSSPDPERDSTPSARAELAEFEELLLADRARTIDLIASLDRNFNTIVDATRLTSTDDEHDPEGSTIAFERSQTSSLLASSKTHLADIDAAMQKLAAGSYGTCEKCGGTIGHERLLARPAARTCISCAK